MSTPLPLVSVLVGWASSDARDMNYMTGYMF